MRQLAQKTKNVQKPKAAQGPAAHRAVQRSPQETPAAPAGRVSRRFGHDFSRVPRFSPASLQIQPKLRVSDPGGIHEQEADRVADQVMRMPDSPPQQDNSPGSHNPRSKTEQTSQVQRLVQAKGMPAKEARAIPPTAHDVLRSPGQPLDRQTRAFMEPRFGYHFGQVRIHDDQAANQAAAALNARAYTLGNHIVFGARQYVPSSRPGRRLLAHELAHVVQQSGSERQGSNITNESISGQVVHRKEDKSKQPSAPDISFKGHYTFYLPALAKSSKKKGFVAQFTMVNGSTSVASVKVLYQTTRHMKELRFGLSKNQTLNPRLLKQDVNTATFDLDGDGKGDLEILLLASSKTRGIRVYVTRPGQTIGTYVIPPPKRKIVPNRGYPMGTLPSGKKYYLQPWTYHLPGGPRYVDEDGAGVNPGLEFQAAATLDTLMKGYLYSIGALAAIAVGAVVVSELAASAVVVGTVARGAGAIRWLFSGTRLIAGGTSAAANLATQAMEHGKDWEKYNWGSVGFDYVMGAVSYSVAKATVTRWPAPLFSKKVGELATWVNFGKQQAVFALYGTVVGALRSYVSNTKPGATVGAQHAEGVLQMVKSVGLQSFLASPQGKSLFPAGFNDPRVAFISRSLTFVTKLAIREVFGVVPQSSPSQTKPEESGQ